MCLFSNVSRWTSGSVTDHSKSGRGFDPTAVQIQSVITLSESRVELSYEGWPGEVML